MGGSSTKLFLLEDSSLKSGPLYFIQLFRERLSNKTVRDNAERYYGQWGFMVFD